MARVAASFCLLLVCSLQQAKSEDIELLPRHPPEHIAGVTYEVLQVLQSYPVDRRNTDQDWKLFGSCKSLSGHRETTHTDSGTTRRRVSKPCFSVLRNCRSDESMEDSVSFCVSLDRNRRYDYMEIDKDQKHVYGRDFTGKCPSSHFENYLKTGAWYPCVCDCESSSRVVDRYFSLLDVVSDEDKVVTGVRFQKADQVFYLQIQQVRLGWNKMIRGKPDWKDIEKVSKLDLLSSRVSEFYKQEGNNDNLLEFYENDFVYAVTSKQNTVLLDDLGGSPNEVLTGLRFRQVGNDLRLEIQVTPLRDETGTLDRNSSRWVYNGIHKSKRVELQLESTKVPERHDTMRFSSFGYQFVKFQVSDFKTDLGQTTVPLIQMTDVVNDEPRPLSGAGIFHHRGDNSAGFVALRLFHRAY